MPTETTPGTYTFDPVDSVIQHTEGTARDIVFKVVGSDPTQTTPPAVRLIVVDPALINATTITYDQQDGSGTLHISDSPLCPWTLSFKNFTDNSVFTENNSWYHPPNSAVFNYTKQSIGLSLPIDVYADDGLGQPGNNSQLHQQYTLKVTPDFSAGRDRLIAIVQAGPG